MLIIYEYMICYVSVVNTFNNSCNSKHSSWASRVPTTLQKRNIGCLHSLESEVLSDYFFLLHNIFIKIQSPWCLEHSLSFLENCNGCRGDEDDWLRDLTEPKLFYKQLWNWPLSAEAGCYLKKKCFNTDYSAMNSYFL